MFVWRNRNSKSHNACRLEDIETVFAKNIAALWNIRPFILDVKATRWLDDYNVFKQGVKDLEVMMQNLITSAFGMMH